MAQSTASSADLQKFYNAADPEISSDARQVLTEYSGIQEANLVSHLRAARDKAWRMYPYPCIGKYSFLDFSISSAPEYPDVLKRVKAGHNILDLACCFGQDIRRLVFDGAPAQNVSGSELEQGFIDMGYERHDERSFARMVSEVAEKTGCGLECKVTAVEDAQWRVEEDWKLLRFCITLV